MVSNITWTVVVVNITWTVLVNVIWTVVVNVIWTVVINITWTVKICWIEADTTPNGVTFWWSFNFHVSASCLIISSSCLTSCSRGCRQLSGYNEPAILQVYIGSEIGRVKPHGFYQACRVFGKNSTPCVEREIDGTSVIEIELSPANHMLVKCVLPSFCCFHILTNCSPFVNNYSICHPNCRERLMAHQSLK